MKPAAFALTTLLSTLIAGAAFAADAPAAASQPAAAAPVVNAATCQACHTSDGSRGQPTYPILQGQHPEYIVKQLMDFKAGKRKNPVMSPMAMGLPDSEVPNVAKFYGSKQAKPGFAKNKDTVALGEQIYRGGIAAKQVPACAGCHSPNGAGIPAQYPRLAGQWSEYTEAQLVAFRAGTRSNSPQMTGVAAKLSDAEIKAVADYVAGLH